jgi:hypothetical protein
MKVRAASSGHGSTRNRPPKTYRGSRKRLRQIGLRGNWSVEFWLFVVFLILALFVAVPWLIRQPPHV